MTAICSKCGRDCVTKLALGKHEAKCEVEVFSGLSQPSYFFSDRHQTKNEKCPRCMEIWADFLILDADTWVCLSCGCHFTPRERLNVVNEWKLKDAERRRSATAN